jgi:chemotaxis protein CheD
MNTITVGMGDLQVTTDPDSVLVTQALGSCIAVLVHDPVRQVGGMIHYMLPLSSITPEKGIERPAMFADTGVPLLFHRMYDSDRNQAQMEELGRLGVRGYVIKPFQPEALARTVQQALGLPGAP